MAAAAAAPPALAHQPVKKLLMHTMVKNRMRRQRIASQTLTGRGRRRGKAWRSAKVG
jgi:hypothetical protein